MYYIGIDLSLTGTGLVILKSDGTIDQQKLISTTPKNEIESRLLSIKFRLTQEINQYDNKTIYIEGLSFGSKGQSMLDLAGLHFLIRTYLFENKISFSLIPPTSLKKFVFGKGTAKKEHMLKETYKKWHEDFNDNNICDAYCLARFAFEKGKQ